jgi:hypothetical protein
MRRRSAVATAVLIGLPLIAAAPARADHVVDVSVDGTSCSWGQSANPVRVHLQTTHVEVTRDPVTGLASSYSCTFHDVPEHVPAAERFSRAEDWHLPSRALRTTTQCWTPDWAPPIRDVRVGNGAAVITPAGTATVTCRF